MVSFVWSPCSLPELWSLNVLQFYPDLSKKSKSINPLNASAALIIKTSHLTCFANQVTGFYMRATLVFNGLKQFTLYASERSH